MEDSWLMTYMSEDGHDRDVSMEPKQVVIANEPSKSILENSWWSFVVILAARLSDEVSQSHCL